MTIQAAAERLRTGAKSLLREWNINRRVRQWAHEIAADLAVEYLRLENETPLTGSLLRKLGFHQQDDDGNWFYLRPVGLKFIDDEWRVQVGGNGNDWEDFRGTLGALRMLAAALGVPLKETE